MTDEIVGFIPKSFSTNPKRDPGEGGVNSEIC